jgi:peptide/nickel transport system substrate-binding protein
MGLVLALCVTSAGVRAQPSHGAVPGRDRHCLVIAGTGEATFVRNFNPFPGGLDLTWGGIYEPLVIVTSAGGGHVYKWLASDLVWSKDGMTLTLTVRHGVKWTDGRPLTSRDVLYTLTAGRQAKVMDQIGLRRRGNDVASISLVGTDKVAIHLKARDSTFVSSVLSNNVMVVPEHVFSKIRSVETWMNPNPVGTGPFAVVERFGDEGYTLGRNPHYWLQGAPHIPCIQRILGTSNESALLQMVQGHVDFSNAFIPNAEKALVAHDPEHFHFFYPAGSTPVGLFLDDTRYPYSLVAFRKALSLAIDRTTLSKLAEYGYAPRVDAIGIDHIWKGWMDPRIAAEAKRLASYDPPAARRMLLEAGFTYTDEALVDPRGHRVVIKAKVPDGWSDWVAAWGIITRNLRDIGIKVDVELAPSWNEWEPDASSTKVATLFWNNFVDGPTPYTYFWAHLDRAAFVPAGHSADATGNWEHFQSPEGTRLLKAFRSTFDPRVQHRLATRIEQLWLDTLPYVPLFAGTVWSINSTRSFVGFPSEHDYYVQPATSSSDFVVALTRIRPA